MNENLPFSEIQRMLNVVPMPSPNNPQDTHPEASAGAAIKDPNPPAVDLYWLPLGAGGWFVRMNGRLYEAIEGVLHHRSALDLYHTALLVTVPSGKFVIENSWPIPAGPRDSRGVVLEGPVGHPRLGGLRAFRYEVRRWPRGTIGDIDAAVASPERVSNDAHQAQRLLELVPHVPTLVWGRDEMRIGDMWNSNSVVSWLLESTGIDAQAIHPPMGGRVPGWNAGIIGARRFSERALSTIPSPTHKAHNRLEAVR